MSYGHVHSPGGPPAVVMSPGAGVMSPPQLISQTNPNHQVSKSATTVLLGVVCGGRKVERGRGGILVRRPTGHYFFCKYIHVHVDNAIGSRLVSLGVNVSKEILLNLGGGELT